MTLMLELSPELEAQLQAVAARRGQDTATVVTTAITDLLHREASPAAAENGTHAEPQMTWEEFEAAMDELAEENPSQPVLAPEATTRAAIYGEHD